MPIGSIISQPAANSINAAYRPILIQATATATDGSAKPPVVYCDVYINGSYYKTFSKTQPIAQAGGSSTWEFDLQDAVQEYLAFHLEAHGESIITEAALTVVGVDVKLRSSGYDTEGFIQPEGTAPVQATSSEPAVGGSGSGSNYFFGVNATLQHEDNQDLADHLDSFKYGTWDGNTFPLSHRPNNYMICADDADSFGIISDQIPTSLELVYTLRAGGSGGDNANLPCAPVGIVGSLPDASVGVAYNAYLPLTGTAPFALNDISKPAWMSINIAGAGVSLTGTPANGDITGSVTVSFHILNCSNANDVLYTEAIAVTAAPPACVPVSGSVASFPVGEAGDDYSYITNLTGTAPFILTVQAKPPWMSINLVADTVIYNGTPGADQIGIDQNVKVTVFNACGNWTTGLKTFPVVSATKNITIVNNTGAPVTLSNLNGTLTFSSGGTFPMTPDGNITIQTMTGVHDIKALHTMPSGVIDTFAGKSQGQVITLTNVGSTNYLWINAQ